MQRRLSEKHVTLQRDVKTCSMSNAYHNNTDTDAMITLNELLAYLLLIKKVSNVYLGLTNSWLVVAMKLKVK